MCDFKQSDNKTEKLLLPMVLCATELQLLQIMRSMPDSMLRVFMRDQEPIRVEQIFQQVPLQEGECGYINVTFSKTGR